VFEETACRLQSGMLAPSIGGGRVLHRMGNRVKSIIAKAVRSLNGNRDKDDSFPLRGHDSHKVATPHVDVLSDQELAELNGLLRWHCFTADSQGRRFGRRSAPGKREAPQGVPDPRILQMEQRFGLAGKSVLEVGCFEGVHTTGLVLRGAKVTAIDSRMENVVKTIVRTAMFGCQATVFKCDVEIEAECARLPTVDLLHHVGVLYHLADPVTHLERLSGHVREGIMLDTHYAEPEKATSTYEVGGRPIAYHHYREGGRQEVFSGMYDHAKWLTLDTLSDILHRIGFGRIEIIEKRAERNGPRVMLFAGR
jgi:2-polyprenyl-3-methyl-5-hydroxy-6-metoxy-1,4-benzoquinol methylase